MQAYKRLDNLCKDMNGIGITGYIKDMEMMPRGEFYVSDWKKDYFSLKHYRYIRNQIAHQNNAEEENLCSPADAVWLETFYARIMHQTDPIAVYYQKTKTRACESAAPFRAAENTASSAPALKKPKKKNRAVLFARTLVLLGVILLCIALFFIVAVVVSDAV